MNLAVKFYSQETNEEGIPGDWPSQVVFLGETTLEEKRLQPGEWTQMTEDEYAQYRVDHRDEYDQWFQSAYPEAMVSQERPIEKKSPQLDLGENAVAQVAEGISVEAPALK